MAGIFSLSNLHFLFLYSPHEARSQVKSRHVKSSQVKSSRLNEQMNERTLDTQCTSFCMYKQNGENGKEKQMQVEM